MLRPGLIVKAEADARRTATLRLAGVVPKAVGFRQKQAERL